MTRHRAVQFANLQSPEMAIRGYGRKKVKSDPDGWLDQLAAAVQLAPQVGRALFK